MSRGEPTGLRKLWARGSKPASPMIINTGQVRSGSIVPHMGSLVHPTARVDFRFATGKRLLELPASSKELFDNGILATARKVFPASRGFDVRLDTRPMSFIVSLMPGGLPPDSIERYVRALPHDLELVARRNLGREGV